MVQQQCYSVMAAQSENTPPLPPSRGDLLAGNAGLSRKISVACVTSLINWIFRAFPFSRERTTLIMPSVADQTVGVPIKTVS